MNLMPLIPYADWMVSITYWGANQYVICKTGVGIGQHIYDFIKQYPLAELIQSIFNSSNGLIIDKIHIL